MSCLFNISRDDLINFYFLFFRQETKKFESIREKLNKSKLCNEDLKDEVSNLRAELTSYENRDKKQDHIFKEHKKQIYDLNEKIKSFDKQKVSYFRY